MHGTTQPNELLWLVSDCYMYSLLSCVYSTFSFNAHVSWGCVYRWVTCRETENHYSKLVLGTDGDHILCCSYITCCTLPLYINRVPGDIVGEGEMAVAWPFVAVVPWQFDVIAIRHRITKNGRSSCGWWRKETAKNTVLLLSISFCQIC